MVKKGYTLAEALVVMAVVSIFFAAASKVLTVKPTHKKQMNPHGYFECYLDGGQLKQKYVRENIESMLETVDVCTFSPPIGIAFYSVNIYGTDNYHSGIEPYINNTLSIKVTESQSVDEKTGLPLVDSSNNPIIEGKVTLSAMKQGEKFEETYDKSTSGTDEKKAVEDFFKVIYPKAEMYNDGNIFPGIFLSW